MRKIDRSSIGSGLLVLLGVACQAQNVGDEDAVETIRGDPRGPNLTVKVAGTWRSFTDY
jgi:hypothetical protein